MTEYNPDKWLVIMFGEPDPHYRVFGTWSGSYLNGDSWRMNSGIVDVTEDDTHYHFKGHSGSVYHCRKGLYGSTAYGYGILENYMQGNDISLDLKVMDINTKWKDVDWLRLS